MANEVTLLKVEKAFPPEMDPIEWTSENVF